MPDDHPYEKPDAVSNSEFNKQVAKAIEVPKERRYELVIKVSWTTERKPNSEAVRRHYLERTYENLKDDIMGTGDFGGPDLKVERLVPSTTLEGFWREA